MLRDEIWVFKDFFLVESGLDVNFYIIEVYSSSYYLFFEEVLKELYN